MYEQAAKRIANIRLVCGIINYIKIYRRNCRFGMKQLRINII